MIDFGPLEEPVDDLSQMRRPRRKKGGNRPVGVGRRLFMFLLDLVMIVGGALLLSLLIKTFIARSFFIPSGSMEQTLQVNDRIVVSQLTPEIFPIERGDILVFSDPGMWLSSTPPAVQKDFWVEASDWLLSAFGITAPDSQQHLVKRTIGLPGDHVECCSDSGKLIINGVEITEPYLAKGVEPSALEFDVKVPADSFWMMGDNRSNSSDSRYHQNLPSKGFVAAKYVVGKAIVVSWPLDRWKWLDNYPDVFKDVPKP